jgi:hypothetical protein
MHLSPKFLPTGGVRAVAMRWLAPGVLGERRYLVGNHQLNPMPCAPVQPL